MRHLSLSLSLSLSLFSANPLQSEYRAFYSLASLSTSPGPCLLPIVTNSLVRSNRPIGESGEEDLPGNSLHLCSDRGLQDSAA
jgi:hypothetical protein